jgi:hypothetical protein
MDANKKYKLNRMNKLAREVGLGDLIDAAEASDSSLVDGKIWIGDANDIPAEKTLSGDVTMTREGVTAIGANKVVTAMILADNVTNAKLADDCVSLEQLDNGITPSHLVRFAGKHTTVGGGASEDITVTGAVAGDMVVASLITKGATPRTLLTAITGTDKVTLTFSGDPSTDHVVGYIVLNAAS